jgi:dipeptidyl aminopeptidase/acylaminoacyl peptidase
MDSTPDGRFLVFSAEGNRTSIDLWLQPLAAGAKAIPLIQQDFDQSDGRPSPDGRWLAYVTNDSDTYQVNVRAMHGAGVRRQISTDGGSQPQWRRNGDELIYMAPDRALMSVAIQTSAETFNFEPPRRLFRTRTRSLESQGTERAYAVTSDGQRILVANATEEAKSALIVVDLNWRSAFDK